MLAFSDSVFEVDTQNKNEFQYIGIDSEDWEESITF
jgi:hypothetical protein